jgi:hypothetical protein
MYHGALFNTACLIADGKILGFVGKQNLAGEGIHYEPRWFKRWPDGVHAETVVAGNRYPMGDLIFDCGGIRLMLTVPEEKEFDHPGSILYFTVDDITAVHEDLKSKGVEFRDAPHLIAKMPDHELWMAFFRDGEGNTLALMHEKR